MKVGVKIGPALGPDVARAARAAERTGFDSVWLSERVVTPLDKPHAYDPMVDPWIALAYVAAVTERVRLGTSVSQIALRPPVLMARELATLDRLSTGRLIVGAGAGWVREEFEAAGVGFDDRGGRLNESIRAIRRLWTAPEQGWEGTYVRIPPVGIVRPLTPGGPPIFLGGVLEPGLRRAARLGDGFIATTRAVQELAALRGRLLELREQYGRTGDFPFYTQASPPSTAEEARRMADEYASLGVDGLILTYPGDVPDAFLAAEEATRALLEAARA
ncbi:MAG TPA: TIGR03619 family F420-dependent LLM class oxidoreductase [Dehalococcoidia bacterium]|nr:TIGR03619 family F420-dependent LLM class oxidoreductase [Dehalococcoidia bacterium]